MLSFTILIKRGKVLAKISYIFLQKNQNKKIKKITRKIKKSQKYYEKITSKITTTIKKIKKLLTKLKKTKNLVHNFRSTLPLAYKNSKKPQSLINTTCDQCFNYYIYNSQSQTFINMQPLDNESKLFLPATM